MALSTWALTTVDTLRKHLTRWKTTPNTSEQWSDEALGQLIDQVSAAIQSYCRHTLVETELELAVDVEDRVIALYRLGYWPISEITELLDLDTGVSIPEATTSGSTGWYCRTLDQDAGIIRLRGFSPQRVHLEGTVGYAAGTPDLAQLEHACLAWARWMFENPVAITTHEVMAGQAPIAFLVGNIDRPAVVTGLLAPYRTAA